MIWNSRCQETMNIFEKNILSVYQDDGRRWLDGLPRQIQELETLWNLEHLNPLNTLSYNYVLSGFQSDTPIILKLSPDTTDLNREARALDAFRGLGTVSVLNRRKNALLLEQAVPGHSLKNHPPKSGKNNIEIACNAAQRLHQASLPMDADFPKIEEWLATLDKKWDIPNTHLLKARLLKQQLLAKTSSPRVLLHGDLHQGNILSHENDWLVIDPKGVIGFPINDLWACVESPNDDLQYISKRFGYPSDEVINWYYVHLVLAACWQVEDNLDATLFLKLADAILPHV